VSTGNGLKDTMNFGKMKGKTIAEVINTDPRYLCWLRDDVAKSKSQSFLDQEANDKLDDWLEKYATKREKSQYRHWRNAPPTFLVKVTADDDRFLDEDEQAIADILNGHTPLNGRTPMPEPVVTYTPSADWGSW
jgi:hypothetical protein